jgi:hypothetical protein
MPNLFEELVFLFLLPEFLGSCVEDFAVSGAMGAVPDKEIYAYSHLNAEYIVRRAGELGVSSEVTTQIKNKDAFEVAGQVFAHAVGRD